MRVLSRNERSDLHPPTDLPIDLRESFLPMQILIADGLGSMRQQQRVSREEAQLILREIDDSLGLQPLVRQGQSRVEWSRPNSIELSHYSFPETSVTRTVYPAYGLVALDRLLTRQELGSIGITPMPGYLYLSAHVSFSTSGGSRRGSVLLRESSFYDTFRYQGRWPGSEYLVRRWQWPAELLEDWETKVDPEWRGPLADIEHCLNARCVHSFAPIPPSDGSEVVHRFHVLATPFELPPGFVIDTAFRLREMKSRIPRVAKTFLECTMEEQAIPKDYSPPYDFPHGAPALNDDRRWIFSKRPWFVQHILLARIIGGSYWRSNLQRYEMTGKEPD